MFALSAHRRIFLYSKAVDMRKGFDGLSGLVQQQMGMDACSGDAFLFVGRRLDRLKVLVWEPDGFWLYYKRLEAGTFRLPDTDDGPVLLSRGELSLLLEGLEVEVKRRRKRYQKPAVLI